MTIRFKDQGGFTITDAPNVSFTANGVKYEGLAALESLYPGGDRQKPIETIPSPTTVLYQKGSFSSNDADVILNINNVLIGEVSALNATSLNLYANNATSLSLYAGNATELKLNGFDVFNGHELTLPNITEMFQLNVSSYTGIIKARFDNATGFTDIYAHMASEVHINTAAIEDATTFDVETNENTPFTNYPLPANIKRFIFGESWFEVKTGAELIVNGTRISTN